MSLQYGAYLLEGKIQPYAWGGYTYIKKWLGELPDASTPSAEYWLGAHPLAVSRLVTEQGLVGLDEALAVNKEAVLGKKVVQTFDTLPYLLKLLDVREMLSIQVHPTKAAAEAGFAAENAQGIPANAANRNYKDANHKPEVMVALSEFWLLHGFKTPALLQEVWEQFPVLQPLAMVFEQGGYKALYETVMTMPEAEADTLLKALIADAIEAKSAGSIAQNDPRWWVHKYYTNGAPAQNIDKGIFSIYLLNIVHVSPGEAVFQDAGILHAYLEGQNVELMANSDNVLRGGLTPKHVDVPELMKHVRFEPVVPQVMRGNATMFGAVNYPCPVADFGIDSVTMPANGSYQGLTNSLEIWLVHEGAARVHLGSNYHFDVIGGQAFAVFAEQRFSISSSQKTNLYRAFVPAM
jgi:mannose-6-phosphate isomerase